MLAYTMWNLMHNTWVYRQALPSTKSKPFKEKCIYLRSELILEVDYWPEEIWWRAGPEFEQLLWFISPWQHWCSGRGNCVFESNTKFYGHIRASYHMRNFAITQLFDLKFAYNSNANASVLKPVNGNFIIIWIMGFTTAYKFLSQK